MKDVFVTKELEANKITIKDAKGVPRMILDGGTGEYFGIHLFGPDKCAIEISIDGGRPRIMLRRINGMPSCGLVLSDEGRSSLVMYDDSGRPAARLDDTITGEMELFLFKNGQIRWPSKEGHTSKATGKKKG